MITKILNIISKVVAEIIIAIRRAIVIAILDIIFKMIIYMKYR